METKLYKCAPLNWDERRSFLICKRVIGRKYVFYEVVKRWSINGYGEEGTFSNSLKGVTYSENEIKLI